MTRSSFVPLALALFLGGTVSACCCRGNPPPPKLVPAPEPLEKALTEEVKSKPSLIEKLCGKKDFTGLRDLAVKVTGAPSYDQIEVTINGKPYVYVEDPPASSNGKPLVCAGVLLVAAYALEKDAQTIQIESIKLKAVTTPGVVFDAATDKTEFHTPSKPSKPPTPSTPHRRRHHWG